MQTHVLKKGTLIKNINLQIIKKKIFKETNIKPS